MKFVITIPGAVPPSGNEMRRKYRHPMAYKALREQWYEWIYNAAMADGLYARDLPWLTKKKAKVSIHVTHGRARLLDDANLNDGLKPVYDCLKLAHIIVNDSMRWMHRVPPTQSRTKEPKEVCTRITVEIAE